MKSSHEILSEVRTIFATKWETREGKKVPEAEDVRLGNDAVTLDGTVLYADMTDSTALVNNFKDWFAAGVYKSYLMAACHIIRNNNGTITAFDGDRVMAVYIGNVKNSLAAKSALQINYIVSEINVAIKAAYPNTAYKLRQAIGIDTTKLFVSRTGIRNSNDLVWVGRSANYAAKLCGLVDGSYTTVITESVFNVLTEEMKYGGNPRKVMWDKGYWQERGVTIYKSNWWWKF
jgi:class 3 adenylate cyclase